MIYSSYRYAFWSWRVHLQLRLAARGRDSAARHVWRARQRIYRISTHSVVQRAMTTEGTRRYRALLKQREASRFSLSLMCELDGIHFPPTPAREPSVQRVRSADSAKAVVETTTAKHEAPRRRRDS